MAALQSAADQRKAVEALQAELTSIQQQLRLCKLKGVKHIILALHPFVELPIRFIQCLDEKADFSKISCTLIKLNFHSTYPLLLGKISKVLNKNQCMHIAKNFKFTLKRAHI